MREVTLPDIKHSLKDIKTMGSHINRMRARTPQGALVEMTALANEWQRIQIELAHSKKRSAQMRARLREIRERERFLSQFTRLGAGRLRPKESRFAEMTLQY